jgi:excisionase family DNA binding protein
MSRHLKFATAARRLGVSERTLRAMIRSGEFPAPLRRNSRWIRIPSEDVEAYLRGLEAKRKQQQPV